jgi:drug/metabolite transporter (DMT)-like permease
MHSLRQKISNSSNVGIVYMILSVLCFSVVNVIAKTLHHIPVHELIFFRALVSFFLCWWYIRNKNLSFWGTNRTWLVMRGLTGLARFATLFFDHKTYAACNSEYHTIFVANIHGFPGSVHE